MRTPVENDVHRHHCQALKCIVFFVFVCLFCFRHGYFLAVGRMRVMLNLIMVMTINMQ